MSVNKIEKRYRDGTYLTNNPNWDRQDCLWKANLVNNILNEFKIKLKSVCEIGCGTGDVLVHLKQFYPPDGHLKIPHPWPGQNPPPRGRQNGVLFSCFSFLTQVF